MIDKILYYTWITFIILICIFEVLDKSINTFVTKMDFFENLIWYITGFTMYFLYFSNSILYYIWRRKKLKSLEKIILLIIMIIQLIFCIYGYSKQIIDVLIIYKIL